MNKRIEELIKQSYDTVPHERDWDATSHVFNKEKFAKLLIEETLAQVDDRCYGRGENQWYYEDDKKWIRMHFFGGKLS